MEEYQLEWVVNHIGHKKSVHLDHYRALSGFIEKVHISKVLMIQDMNMTHKFAGIRIEDIDFKGKKYFSWLWYMPT